MEVACQGDPLPQVSQKAEATATPRKLLDLCGSDDSSPRSTCSTTWSSAAGSSPSNTPASSTESVSFRRRTQQPSEEEEGQASEPEEEEVDAVSRHLHNMNAASDDVNALQQELASQQRERAAFERLWAVGSARLARSASFSPSRKTQQRQRREHAKRAALEASNRYAQAVVAGLADEQLAGLLQEHEACLAEYRAFAPKSGEVPHAVQMLCQAEHEHRSQLADVDEAIGQLTGQLVAAKASYRDAMNNLQEISDNIHLRRASPKAVAAGRTSRAFLEQTVDAHGGVQQAASRQTPGQEQSIPQAMPRRSEAAAQ